jgi:hypothetical protein
MAEESKLESKVADKSLSDYGICSVKWGKDGWPDRIFLIPGGQPLIIEFKSVGEKLSDRQKFRIHCLTIWGYKVEVHTTAKLALSSIFRELESAKLPKKIRKVSH